ncbi:OB-fold nucleic acid binding domain-containing protein [Rhodococcus antarcticus]|jgi:RecG-like helicase|uniref:OB-fold nucleic acid binding domain-containing protein n=1 Tax=Rhodococcus antarcticus TaxID=2987751 RepID=A0ABY6P2P0_9NOCA|nr:OB-fold nucleic acid binding domain-containing protein [Rhodococcus antarcticus]UZJ25907.1 OB-fold nucleic acid binding domain-containing protein [Rhodococcus antarcticus]
MASTAAGYFRRLARRITTDVDTLDAREMSETSEASGAQRACDCSRGEEVTVLGRLRSVEVCPQAAAATLEAELFDGTEGVTLVWIGRRRIPGIEPGRTIRVHGRLAERDGRKVLYNPEYELKCTS